MKPPDLDEPGPSKSGFSARNHAQETPAAEKQFHQQGGAVQPTPESVAYHAESERCDACEYFASGNCSFLQMPVDAGGHCMRFEDRGEDMGETYEEDQEVGEGA